MFKKIGEKIERTLVSVSLKMAESKAVRSERGDTNFISILIILGVVILLAGVFIGFKEKIVTEVQGIINNFSIKGGAGNQGVTP